MANNKKLQVALAAVLVLLFVGVVYLGFQALQPPEYGGLGDEKAADDREPRDPIVSPRTDGELKPGSGDVIAGGVERPRTDLPGDDEKAPITEGRQVDVGSTPAIAPDANEQVALAAEAARTGRYPERLSPLFVSDEVFDRNAYANDADARATYLKTPQPGRVFAPAQPGPGVPRIRGACNPHTAIEQGEWVILRVQAVPEMPVTFTSFDLGEFENRLTTITVEADASGFAHASFTAPPGTFGPTRILAASPVTSGQVRLTVDVSIPEEGLSNGS